MSLNPKSVVDQCSAEFAAGRASRDAEIRKLVEALQWIAVVNAMDYEYQKVAQDALREYAALDALVKE